MLYPLLVIARKGSLPAVSVRNVGAPSLRWGAEFLFASSGTATEPEKLQGNGSLTFLTLTRPSDFSGGGRHRRERSRAERKAFSIYLSAPGAERTPKDFHAHLRIVISGNDQQRAFYLGWWFNLTTTAREEWQLGRSELLRKGEGQTRLLSARILLISFYR